MVPFLVFFNDFAVRDKQIVLATGETLVICKELITLIEDSGAVIMVEGGAVSVLFGGVWAGKKSINVAKEVFLLICVGSSVIFLVGDSWRSDSDVVRALGLISDGAVSEEDGKNITQNSFLLRDLLNSLPELHLVTINRVLQELVVVTGVLGKGLILLINGNDVLRGTSVQDCMESTFVCKVLEEWNTLKLRSV